MRLAVHLCSRSLATTSTVLGCGSTFTHRPSSVFPCVQCIAHRRQRRTGCRGRATAQIFDLQGSSCVDDPPPNIFDKCFTSGTSIKFIIQLRLQSGSADFQSAQPSYRRLLIQDREHGRNLRSTTTALCQPFTTTTFCETRFRCSAPAVWNSLPQTVLSSDSVAVFKLRLKTFLFSQAFSSFSAH